MRALNRDHRHVDEVTDVLAFPIDETAGPPGLPRLLGDVVVCLDEAQQQAAEVGRPAGDELAALVVHGTLHLLGYDHESDAGEMLALQDRLLSELGGLPWPD
jgi:probable rRNA maturation factor